MECEKIEIFSYIFKEVYFYERPFNVAHKHECVTTFQIVKVLQPF